VLSWETITILFGRDNTNKVQNHDSSTEFLLKYYLKTNRVYFYNFENPDYLYNQGLFQLKKLV
jgi:hypothetical protein